MCWFIQWLCITCGSGHTFNTLRSDTGLLYAAAVMEQLADDTLSFDSGSLDPALDAAIRRTFMISEY